MRAFVAIFVLALALSVFGQGTNPVMPFPQAKYSLTATSGLGGTTIDVTNIMPTLTFVTTWNGSTNTQALAATNVSVSLVNTGLTVTTQNVRVKVTDSGGNSSSTIKPITVVPNVVASFSATPTNGVPPLAVLFTNLSSGTYTNATWVLEQTNGVAIFTTNTLAGSILYTYSNISTNSPSLTVAGYNTSTLTLTNYITAISNSPNALAFDGVAAYADATNSPAFSPAGGLTVEFWAFLTGAGVSQPNGIVGVADANFQNGWGFEITPDAATAYFNVHDGASDTTTTFTPATNVWTHIAAVWDTTNITVYVDGTAGTPTAYGSALPSSVSPLQLGVSRGTRYAGVMLSQVRINSNAVYSANFTPATNLTALAGTVALYTFPEGTGTNSVDQSGNGNDLILYNGVVWTNWPPTP